MYHKIIILYYIVHHVLAVSEERHEHFSRRIEENIFRNDYKYLEETQSFYKNHGTIKTWSEAKNICVMEGATLFYPQNQREIELLREKLPTMSENNFIGISALLSTRLWVTADGIPLDDIDFPNWAPNEPNNAIGQENCVILRTDKYDDRRCTERHAFICKKTLESIRWNEDCNMPLQGYEYSEYTGSCYRFSLTPMTWSDAYVACTLEQSYLAVINSQEEANYLANISLAMSKETVGSDYVRGAVHIGFQQLTDERWQTINGTQIEESGYFRWGHGEPNGGAKEKCGSMFYEGTLNDIDCTTTKMQFICEHEVVPS